MSHRSNLKMKRGSLADNILPFILLFTAGTKHYSFSLLCTDGAHWWCQYKISHLILGQPFGGSLRKHFAAPACISNQSRFFSIVSILKLSVNIRLQAQDVSLAPINGWNEITLNRMGQDYFFQFSSKWLQLLQWPAKASRPPVACRETLQRATGPRISAPLFSVVLGSTYTLPSSPVL